MGYFRLVSKALPTRVPGTAYLEAFQGELDYVFATSRRPGAGAAEVEDLVQGVFLVLRRNWPGMDTSLPLRPYLFGVALRIVSMHRRRRRRETLSATLEAKDIARTLSIARFGVYTRLRRSRKELATAVRRGLKEGVGN